MKLSKSVGLAMGAVLSLATASARADTVVKHCNGTTNGRSNVMTFTWDSDAPSMVTMSWTNVVGGDDSVTLKNKSEDPTKFEVKQINAFDGIKLAIGDHLFDIDVTFGGQPSGGSMTEKYFDPNAGGTITGNTEITMCQ